MDNIKESRVQALTQVQFMHFVINLLCFNSTQGRETTQHF